MKAAQTAAEEHLRTINQTTTSVLKKLQKEINEFEDEKRVSIPSGTKKAVYERARGRCERCGRPMKQTDKGANFHHLKEPTAKSKPSTIQFLCAYCHTSCGHKYTRKGITRMKVGKDTSSPFWEKKSATTARTKKRTVSKKQKSKPRKSKK